MTATVPLTRRTETVTAVASAAHAALKPRLGALFRFAPPFFEQCGWEAPAAVMATFVSGDDSGFQPEILVLSIASNLNRFPLQVFTIWDKFCNIGNISCSDIYLVWYNVAPPTFLKKWMFACCIFSWSFRFNLSVSLYLKWTFGR